MSQENPFKYYKTSPEIIKLAVMYYWPKAGGVFFNRGNAGVTFRRNYQRNQMKL